MPTPPFKNVTYLNAQIDKLSAEHLEQLKKLDDGLGPLGVEVTIIQDEIDISAAQVMGKTKEAYELVSDYTNWVLLQTIKM